MKPFRGIFSRPRALESLPVVVLLTAAGFLRLTPVTLAAEPAPAAAAKSAAHDTAPHDVLVYSTISDAGQKVVPPSPDKPVYYVSVAGGFHQEGPSVARDDAEKVTADQVLGPLRKAL